MKSISLVTGLVILSLVAHSGIAGGPSSLTWRTFDAGMAEAQRSNKKVLIDVYTDWCGWCKKMDASTYTDKSLTDYLNRHYVVIKMNAERSTTVTYRGREYSERELAASFGVTGYPATVFLTSSGDPITLYPGYAEAKDFRHVVSYIAEDHYKTRKFDEYLSTVKD